MLEEERVTTTEDNMAICRITNDPKKATDQEKTLQDVIESLTVDLHFLQKHYEEFESEPIS